MSLRRVHAMLAIVAAPTILFFALTGAFQLFDLHETHGSYRPPALLAELARLHKEQVLTHGTAKHALVPTLLRIVFLVATAALVASTSLGLVLGLRQMRGRRIRVGLLVAGALILALLALLSQPV